MDLLGTFFVQVLCQCSNTFWRPCPHCPGVPMLAGGWGDQLSVPWATSLLWSHLRTTLKSTLLRSASPGPEHNFCLLWHLVPLSPQTVPQKAIKGSGNGTEGSGVHEVGYRRTRGAWEGDYSPPACLHPAFPADLNKKYIYIKNIMKNKKKPISPQ